MGLVPHATSVAIVEEELAAASAWAERHELSLDADPEALHLELALAGPSRNGNGSDAEDYLLLGDFDDYRAIPPAWRFVGPCTKDEIGSPAFPAGGTELPFPATVLHPNAVICAHFNRLAYAAHNGPHPEWSDLGNWQNVREAETLALTIAAMLDRIWREVVHSAGRMAPLP